LTMLHLPTSFKKAGGRRRQRRKHWPCGRPRPSGTWGNDPYVCTRAGPILQPTAYNEMMSSPPSPWQLAQPSNNNALLLPSIMPARNTAVEPTCCHPTWITRTWTFPSASASSTHPIPIRERESNCYHARNSFRPSPPTRQHSAHAAPEPHK